LAWEQENREQEEAKEINARKKREREDGYAADRDRLRKRRRLAELGYWDAPGDKGKPKMPGINSLKSLFENNKGLLESVGWEESPPARAASDWATRFFEFLISNKTANIKDDDWVGK